MSMKGIETRKAKKNNRTHRSLNDLPDFAPASLDDCLHVLECLARLRRDAALDLQAQHARAPRTNEHERRGAHRAGRRTILPDAGSSPSEPEQKSRPPTRTACVYGPTAAGASARTRGWASQTRVRRRGGVKGQAHWGWRRERETGGCWCSLCERGARAARGWSGDEFGWWTR